MSNEFTRHAVGRGRAFGMEKIAEFEREPCAHAEFGGGPEVPHRVVVVDQLLPIRHGGLGFERGDDERPHLLRRVLHDDDAERAIAAEGVTDVLHHRAQDVGWPIGRGRAVPVRVHEVAVCIGEGDGPHESHPIVDCDRQHDRDGQQKR